MLKIGNLKVYGIIYKIQNNIDGKIYIGQTIQEFNKRYDYGGVDSERVYNYHKNHKLQGYYYNKHLLSAMNKYGYGNFTVCKSLDVAFSQEELNIKEKCWIQIYDSINNGYNMNDGGDNSLPSEETKKKMSDNNKGEGNPNYGKTHSEETRLKMRQNHWSKQGYKSWNKGLDKTQNPLYGTHHSEETKNKIRKANTGKVFSNERKKKISDGRKGGDNPSARKVICITTNKEFDTSREGSIFYKCDGSGIIKCCKGKRKTCGQLENGIRLEWMYYEDYLKLNIKKDLKVANYF